MVASTRDAIMTAAERLFVARGIEAVPLREIGHAAGQRNNNAVQYHFGDRLGLVGAIYAHRSEALNARRLQLLEQLDSQGVATDPSGLVRAMLEPHARSVLDPDNHFVPFLARLLLDLGTISTDGYGQALPFMSAYYEIRERVRIGRADLPRAEFDRRYSLMFNCAIVLLASNVVDDDDEVDALLDEVVAIYLSGLVARSVAGAGVRFR